MIREVVESIGKCYARGDYANDDDGKRANMAIEMGIDGYEAGGE